MSGATGFAVPPGRVAGLAALCSAGLLMITPLHAQDRFVGTWSGELDVGAAQLRLVLHVELGEEGYTAALDSPDQGAFGIKASGVTTTGDFATATSHDFAADAEAALAYARTRADIDPGAIGLIGHSEGGLVAPLVASRVAVDWIVMIAGPGLPGDSLLALQVDALTEAAGMPSAQRAATNSLQRRLMDIAVSDRDPVAAREEIAGLLRAEVPGLAEEQALAQAEALTSPWMRGFLRHDPRIVLRELTVPVLAVNGENDLQVLPGPNLAAIESALADAGNENFTTVELEGLNHLLQTSETGLVTEYGRIEQTIAPSALETIGDWIVARARA